MKQIKHEHPGSLTGLTDTNGKLDYWAHKSLLQNMLNTNFAETRRKPHEKTKFGVPRVLIEFGGRVVLTYILGYRVLKLAVVAEAKGKLLRKHEPGNCSNKQRLRLEGIPCNSNPDPRQLQYARHGIHSNGDQQTLPKG